MVISARSKSPLGPWQNSPYNPVIRTKDSSERWWSKGHGTIFEDTKGKWWIVFHGYENGFYNMGRQTLLQPIEWTEDGWYKIPDGIKTDEPIKRSTGTFSDSVFTLNDNFEGNTLKPQWKFFGEYDASRFILDGNGIDIKANSRRVLPCPSRQTIPIAQVECLWGGDRS
jgi:beta-xylosidase